MKSVVVPPTTSNHHASPFDNNKYSNQTDGIEQIANHRDDVSIIAFRDEGTFGPKKMFDKIESKQVLGGWAIYSFIHQAECVE